MLKFGFAALLLTVAALAAFGQNAGMLNQGVQINTPDERIVLVRTDQQPSNQHHPVLDLPQYSRLRPYTVTLREKDGQAIKAIGIQFDVVDQNGVNHPFESVYDMPPGSAVVERGSSCQFWPSGHLSKDIPGHPLMQTPGDKAMDMIEHAKSVTVSVTYVEFEDGTVVGTDRMKMWVTMYRQQKRRGK